MPAAMSKRQRFSVELCQDHITVISWTRLLAEAERMTTSEAAAPSDIVLATTIPGSQPFVRIATIRENLNTAASNLLEPREKLKRRVSNSTRKQSEMMLECRQHREDRNVVKFPSRAPKRGSEVRPLSNVKKIIEAKKQFSDESMAMKLARPKGKVHRSMPVVSGETTCLSKANAKACFSSFKKDPGALSSKLKLKLPRA